MSIEVTVMQQWVRDFHVKHQFSRDLLRPNRTSHDWYWIGLDRAHLIAEELGEMTKAWSGRDVVGIADGLADLLYVVLGTAVAAGIDIGPILAEVHRSNMTKDPANGVVLHPHKGPTYSPPNLVPLLKQQGLL